MWKEMFQKIEISVIFFNLNFLFYKFESITLLLTWSKLSVEKKMKIIGNILNFTKAKHFSGM